MPFHLPPLTRRQLLGRSALAAAGLFLPGLARADDEADRWILFSDPHIAADPATISREISLAEHLRQSVRQSLAGGAKPLGALVDGDCALKDGQPGDYSTFLDLIKPLREAGQTVHCTLGNHDHRENFRNAFALQANKVLESKHASLVPGRHANWLLLDSLDKVNITPGLLDAEQREWIAKTLDANAAKPCIVMVHHNPVFANAATSGSLRDTAELFEILAPRKHVKALVFGHSHRWEFTKRDDIHLINLPAVSYSFSADQPTGWTDCNITPAGASFELRAHDEKHRWHGQKKELVWRG